MGTIIPFVPLAKSFAKYLPKIAGRKYGEVEAAFSLMIDYDDQNDVTISGYAKLWKWNKKTVAKFIKDHGACIAYPKDTKNYKNQRGLISILKRDLRGINKGLIAFIDNKDLAANRDLKGIKEGLKKDKSLVTTIEPKPKPEEKELSDKIKMIVDYLNKKLGTKYTYKADKTIKPIKARLNEGHSGKEFKIVIDKKFNDWNGTDDAKYLRPETLFGTKFEGYLNQLDGSGQKQNDGSAEAQEEYETTQALLRP